MNRQQDFNFSENMVKVMFAMSRAIGAERQSDLKHTPFPSKVVG
jgi:hypothetical protein